MALVSYDYGSGSDEDEEQHSQHSTENQTSSEEKSHLPDLLSHLPKSKTGPEHIAEEKLEDFVPKYQPTTTKEKKPQKVKITIPSLSEFAEDEEPQQKKRKTVVKGSTLLSILPPVKSTPLSTRSFIPQAVASRPRSTLIPKAVQKTVKPVKPKLQEKATLSGSDAEDDDIEVPETYDDEMWQKVCGRPNKRKPVVEEPTIEPPKMIDIAPEPVKPYDGLDNAAFKELVGSSKRPVNIKLIDINEEEILPDKNVWMTKSLTDPETAPKLEIDDPVDPTRKKKHHITYLAEQAVANEQELQTQWSANKYTRNQTRAKYGF